MPSGKRRGSGPTAVERMIADLERASAPVPPHPPRAAGAALTPREVVPPPLLDTESNVAWYVASASTILHVATALDGHVRCDCGFWLDPGSFACPDCGVASPHPAGGWMRRRFRRVLAAATAGGVVLGASATAALMATGAPSLIAFGAGSVSLGATAAIGYVRASSPADRRPMLARVTSFQHHEHALRERLLMVRVALRKLVDAAQSAHAISSAEHRDTALQLARDQRLQRVDEERALEAALVQIQLARLGNTVGAQLHRLDRGRLGFDDLSGLVETSRHARRYLEDARATMLRRTFESTRPGAAALQLLAELADATTYLGDQAALAKVLAADGTTRPGARPDLRARLDRISEDIGHLSASVQAGLFDGNTSRAAERQALLEAAKEEEPGA